MLFLAEAGTNPWPQSHVTRDSTISWQRKVSPSRLPPAPPCCSFLSSSVCGSDDTEPERIRSVLFRTTTTGQDGPLTSNICARQFSASCSSHKKRKEKKYLSHYSKWSIKKKKKEILRLLFFFLFRTALHEFHERGRAITRAKVYKASSSCNEKARKKKVIAKITREASFEIRVLARNI